MKLLLVSKAGSRKQLSSSLNTSSVRNSIRDRQYRFIMQCTTRRAYSKRDLFKTLTSMNIARDHHNRIIHRFITN